MKWGKNVDSLNIDTTILFHCDS